MPCGGGGQTSTSWFPKGRNVSWLYAKPGASNGPIIDMLDMLDMRMADMSRAEQVARRWDGLEQRIDSKIASVGLDGAALERLLTQAIRSGTKAQRIMWLRRAAEAVTEQAPPLEAEDAMDATAACWQGVPCSFLKEGRCSIYRHRPLACRLQINMDDDDIGSAHV